MINSVLLALLFACEQKKTRIEVVTPSVAPTTEKIPESQAEDLVDQEVVNRFMNSVFDEEDNMRKSEVPSLVSSDLTIVTGKEFLDKTLVEQVIRKNITQISYCFVREATQQPNLSGKITVTFVITEKGSVSQVESKLSTVNSSSIEPCVLSRIKRFQFQAPSGGNVEVSNTFSYNL